MQKNDYYVIHMPRVAAALREMGFTLKKVSSNRNKPQYNVYYFEDTQELRAALPIAVEKAKH